MTLRLVSERPQPRAPRRRYNNDEDAIIVAMCAEGATAAEIGAALGKDVNCIYARAARLNVQPRRLPPGYAAGRKLPPSCARCGVLLARAPAGHGDVCGWCVEEEPAP